MSPDAAALLRSRHVQVTAQRIAILAAVSENPHVSADQLAQLVRADLGTISRQAVYDGLTVLVEAGLVRRIQPAGSAARFEDRAGDNHHHLACRQCGAVVDVDCATGSTPCLTPSDDAGFEVDEAEVVYWGHCPACRTQREDQRPHADPRPQR